MTRTVTVWDKRYEVMDVLILWLSTLGLCLGIAGAIGLAVLTKTFITTNPDGSQRWGPPNGIPNDVWLRRNIRIRRTQNWGFPLSYGAVGVGFVFQLAALWLPKLAQWCSLGVA